MAMSDTSPQTGVCGIILLGVVVGAILGGVLLCVAVDVAWDRERRAMEQEIWDRVANGEDDAELQVIMKHKTMPIVAAMGFFMELGVAAVVGGGVGGLLATKWKLRPAELESSLSWRVVRYEHNLDRDNVVGDDTPPPAENRPGG